MNVNVKFFAVTRDIVGTHQLVFNLNEGSTTNDLFEHLVKQYPKFSEWKPFIRVAVNQEYVTQEIILTDEDEVALIPPVSGG
jgi:molybdopterin converting factor subunit 1